MPRASWKGFIRISLVSVPVEAYTASATAQSQIALNQLHANCGERIRHKRTCPVHGEVPYDDIVMGYEYAKDQYAVIDPDEIESLRSEADRSINVDRFVAPAGIDPICFSGKSYYLIPDGKAGQKPYALLHRAMTDEKVCGIAQVVISNREQLVMLRPRGKLLTISILQYAVNLKPAGEFEGLIDDGEVSARELKLAKTLIDATREDDAGLDRYRDLYAERMHELVEAKVAGREVIKLPTAQAPPAINLIDALKASLEYKKAKAALPKRAAGAKRGKGAVKPTKRRTG